MVRRCCSLAGPPVVISEGDQGFAGEKLAGPLPPADHLLKLCVGDIGVGPPKPFQQLIPHAFTDPGNLPDRNPLGVTSRLLAGHRRMGFGNLTLRPVQHDTEPARHGS